MCVYGEEQQETGNRENNGKNKISKKQKKKKKESTGRVSAYLALPRQVVLLIAASVQGNEQVCARVSVSNGELGGRHFGS